MIVSKVVTKFCPDIILSTCQKKFKNKMNLEKEEKWCMIRNLKEGT